MPFANLRLWSSCSLGLSNREIITKGLVLSWILRQTYFIPLLHLCCEFRHCPRIIFFFGFKNILKRPCFKVWYLYWKKVSLACLYNVWNFLPSEYGKKSTSALWFYFLIHRSKNVYHLEYILRKYAFFHTVYFCLLSQTQITFADRINWLIFVIEMVSYLWDEGT